VNCGLDGVNILYYNIVTPASTHKQLRVVILRNTTGNCRLGGVNIKIITSPRTIEKSKASLLVKRRLCNHFHCKERSFQ